MKSLLRLKPAFACIGAMLVVSCGLPTASTGQAYEKVSFSADDILAAVSPELVSKALATLGQKNFAQLAKESDTAPKSVTIDGFHLELSAETQKATLQMAAGLDKTYGGVVKYWQAIGFNPTKKVSASALHDTLKRFAAAERSSSLNLLAAAYTSDQCTQAHSDVQVCQLTYLKGVTSKNNDLMATANACTQRTRMGGVAGLCNAESGCRTTDSACTPAKPYIMDANCPKNNVCINGGYIENVNGQPGPGQVGNRQYAIAPDNTVTVTDYLPGGQTRVQNAGRATTSGVSTTP